MDGRDGRKRTTEGLWLANDCSQTSAAALEQLLVLDMEGVDSQEKAEKDPKQRTFENRATLFSLAFASVLIINLAENRLGQREGACLPLLETVFASARRMVFHGEKRLLLFVLRDYNEQTPVALHREGITAMLDACWAKAQTMTQVGALNSAGAGTEVGADKRKGWEVLFDLDVYGLPNIIPRGVYSSQALGDLPELFHNPHHPRYVLAAGTGSGMGRGQLFEDGTEVAAVGKKLLEAIISDGQLDVESQRVLVARARCVEARQKALAGLTTTVSGLYAEMNSVTTSALASPPARLLAQADAAVKDAVDVYAQQASHLVPGVYNENRQQLETEGGACAMDFRKLHQMKCEAAEKAEAAAAAERARAAVEAEARERERERLRIEESLRRQQQQEEELRRRAEAAEVERARQARLERERVAEMNRKDEELRRLRRAAEVRREEELRRLQRGPNGACMSPAFPMWLNEQISRARVRK